MVRQLWHVGAVTPADAGGSRLPRFREAETVFVRLLRVSSRSIIAPGISVSSCQACERRRRLDRLAPRHDERLVIERAFPQASRREWVGLGVLTLPCLLYSMDLTVLNLALPHLTADLEPSAAQQLWIVDIYGFLLAGSLVTMGTLGDRIGRRKLLLIGAAAFGGASTLAAFSPSAELLIASRALLGIAGATLAPSTLSLIRNMFLDAKERSFAIGVWVASYSAGAAVGPLIGGALLSRFWWGSVFLVNVPVMLVLLAIGPRLLPEYRDPQAGRLDLASAALSLGAILAVIYGLKQIAAHGASPVAAAAIVAGAAVGVTFVRRQRTLADPLIDLGLFARPDFSAALTTYVVCVFTAFGAFLILAQYLQLVLGMDPLTAGLWTAPSGVALVVGSMLAPALGRRMRPGRAVAAGFAVATAGFLALSQVRLGMGAVMLGWLLLSLGLAPVGTLATDIILAMAPPEKAGAASAISETGAELGGALGIAVLGSIVTAVYRQGAPPGADTLGGAVAAAGRLPGPIGAELLGAARDAFTHSVEVSAGICAAIAAAAAILSWVVLGRATDGGTS
jgi:DHA2 family multidrug resistance protein-like MFS transporter